MTAVAVKGNTVTLTLARAPGVSQMVTMTYNAPASNPVRDLAGNKAGELTESQKVKSVPTVSVGAVYPKVAPGLGDAEFRVTVSQAPASDLAVMLSFEQADEYLAETTATITIPAGQASATRTFGIANDYTLASGALTATIAGVGDGYALAPAPGNAATVQVVVVNPPFIVKWDEDAYTVTEGEAVNATVTLRTAAGVPKPRNDYHVALISVGDSAEAGDDYPDVSLTLAVQPGDWKADGAGFAASETVSVATVNDSDVEADERFYLAVASAPGQLPLGLDCPVGLENLGGATGCSTAVTIEDDDFGVTGVTVTSTPQKASDTYGARENIEFAVAFNQPVTVTGAPTFSFQLGTSTTKGDLVCGLGHGHAAVLLRRGGRDGRRPGPGRDFLAVGLAGERHRDRAGGRDGGPEPDLRRPAGPHRPQGGRPDDARRDGDRHRGGDLDTDADGVRIDDGGHLRAAGDDRDRGHRERGGGGLGRSGVPVHDRH